MMIHKATKQPPADAMEVDLLPDVPPEDRPRHIAIIMDGNGRWAQARGLPRVEGHRNGVRTVRMISETSARLGVDANTLFGLPS
jgi:undecaprenyl diphosphate synthase